MDIFLQAKPSRLTRKEAMFQVKNEGEMTRVSPYHVSSISLARACLMSSDALLLAAEHDIPVLILRRSGKPGLLLYAPDHGNQGRLHRAQAYFSAAPAGTAWMIANLREAILSQQWLLRQLSRNPSKKQKKIAEQIAQMGDIAERLLPLQQTLLTEAGDQIRSLEAVAARSYYQAVNLCLPKSYRFSKRSRRPAKDLFNAALNYGFGMLYNEVHVAILLAGLNPSLGFLHQERPGLPTLVLDAMEAYRPWIEAVVIRLCRSRTLSLQHLTPKKEGVWLNAKGRRSLIEAIGEMWLETIDHAGRRKSRREHLREDLRALRQEMLRWFQER